jgi:hypothetical protein
MHYADWHKNDADTHADSSPSLSWKIGKKVYICSRQRQFTMFFLSHKWQYCHVVKYFGQQIEIF